jgi:VWFA-related protein
MRQKAHHVAPVAQFGALVGVGLAVALLTGAQPSARQSQPPAQQPPAQQPPAQQPPAQQPPATTPSQSKEQEQQPPPRIRTGINYVRVDAIVSDRQGNPVLDLKQEEFKIKEDGKPQAIESFAIVKIDPLEQQLDGPPAREIRSIFDEQREAQRPDVRLFIIMLDDYHVRRGNDMSVRKPLIDFIENSLAPADMVAIMYPLTPITGLTFTRNRSSLISAVEHFQGRRFDYTPRNEFEERYANYPAATVEQVRNQVVMTALKGAAIRLGGLREGRKSIIFVSEGFTTILPPQLNDPVASMPGIGNSARGTSVQNSDRAEWSASVDMVSDLSLIFTEMNRNNTSIYALDPRGLAPFEYDINQGVGSLQVDRKHLEASLDTLRALAENTDGRAIVNTNDLAKGMRQIIRDASGYYLIGYNSAQAPIDGRFHKIDVEVTRKGVDVRARKGYWAYTTEDAARASAPRVEAPAAVTAALATLVEPPRGRPAREWIGTARGGNGKSKVTFAWEPISSAPGDRRPGEEGVSYVTLTALAPDGRPLFRGRVPEQGAAAAPPAPAAAGPSSATFEVPPGRMQLRITVQNASGQVMDSSTSDVTVPDYTTPQVSLGTPRLFRARTPRDVQALKANPAPTPSTDRTFSRTERLVVRVDAYGPGSVPPALTARLLNRAGTAMFDVPVQVSEVGGAEMELAFASLAAGEYLLELNAKAEAGTAQDIVAFRVK